jgi:hypothetical protein
MDPERARAVLVEFLRRFPRPVLDRLVDERFPEQAQFVEDPSQSIVALCTRRAGKSHGLARRLYRAALKHPGSQPLYIALTRRSARNIMWPAMLEINRKLGLQAEPTESSLSIKLPNGSEISLVGADMKNFMERLRGPSYPEVCIDEAGSFRTHLQALIEDVLEPATLDYNGSIVMVGTPGVLPRGMFFEATQEKSYWSKHAWTLYQNPYLKEPKAFVDKLKRQRGWTDQNPTFQREYLGQWVQDLDALVYKFKRDKNEYRALPEYQEYYRILVIDYGYDDQTAFGVTTFSPTLKRVYQEHAEGHKEMVPSEIAERIQALKEQYQPIKIVADTGALGKMITQEMIRRYGLPIQPAEKKEKLTYIHLLNGDFIDGNLLIHERLSALKDQLETLEKDENGMEDPSLPNDLCDVLLYGYREAKHYLGIEKRPTPAPHSKEALEREAERMLEEDLERLEKEKERAWWEEV